MIIAVDNEVMTRCFGRRTSVFTLTLANLTLGATSSLTADGCYLVELVRRIFAVSE